MDVDTHRIISQLDPWNHHNPPIPSLPVIITNQTTLASATLSLQDFRHPEPYVRWAIERRGVQYGYSVPTRLDLDWKVPLEEGVGM
jgi:hypothetical protein